MELKFVYADEIGKWKIGTAVFARRKIGDDQDDRFFELIWGLLEREITIRVLDPCGKNEWLLDINDQIGLEEWP